jgi:5-(carboxyamino)imidazole ribonucleotide synthase
MTCEAASALGVRAVVLAAHESDCAVPVAAESLIGPPGDAAAMAALAERCSVVTFDHEQVDLGTVACLERDGVLVRPGTETLHVALDKAAMRRHLESAGVPVPAYAALGVPGARAGPSPGPAPGRRDRTVAAVEAFAARHGWPVVLKAARGGYDGKGVWIVDGPASAREVVLRAAATASPLLVEEQVPIDAEVAVVVARAPDGSSAAWPAAETAQVDGVCREVLSPGRLDPELRARAADLARRVATAVRAVGVLAVELFSSGGRLLVNEIAARPHNSGHWTIEGACTSQFENHLRAVLDLPLGETAARFPHVASVNVFGAAHGTGAGGGLDAALRVRGAHVHLYGKEARPGRKLGHVTVCGDDATDVRARAWAAARALGTAVPASLDSGVVRPGGLP